ncbi:MAG: DUF6364 family protein [Candidatus Hydrogenedentota bacterium]
MRNHKLTLLLDEETIINARTYAKKQNASISALVKKFFNAVSLTKPNKEKYPAITSELLGVIKGVNLDEVNKEYSAYLTDKYK